MALTELAIRLAKAEDKITKLSDGGGLQLWLTPDGPKRWCLAHRFGGAQKVLAIGVYPTIGRKEARTSRQDAVKLLATGADPSAAKKRVQIEKVNSVANTFEAIATELLEKKRREGKAENALANTEWLFSLANPILGARPIKEIDAPDILAVLRTVESRGKRESAKRLRATIGQVFGYAVATGRADSDPNRRFGGRPCFVRCQASGCNRRTEGLCHLRGFTRDGRRSRITGPRLRASRRASLGGMGRIRF